MTNDKDATKWVNSIVPPNETERDVQNHINSENTSPENDLRAILSPVKPVNLLPQVPNTSNYRKLSENEEHDCEIIGNKRFAKESLK